VPRIAASLSLVGKEKSHKKKRGLVCNGLDIHIAATSKERENAK
jgi:hypothetical protein